jgi:hypothetical protein
MLTLFGAALFGTTLFACAIGGFWGFLSAGKLLAKDENTLTRSRAVALGIVALITIVLSYLAMQVVLGLFTMAPLEGRTAVLAVVFFAIVLLVAPIKEFALLLIVVGLIGFIGMIWGSKMGVSLIRRLRASSSAPKQS